MYEVPIGTLMYILLFNYKPNINITIMDLKLSNEKYRT